MYRIIKIFMAIINSMVQKANAFIIANHFLLAWTITLAFYVTELIMAVISFMIQAQGACTKKQYIFVIYVKMAIFVVSFILVYSYSGLDKQTSFLAYYGVHKWRIRNVLICKV
jgi:hypothetical protein